MPRDNWFSRRRKASAKGNAGFSGEWDNGFVERKSALAIEEYERLIAKIDIIRRATEDGQRNEPPTNARGMNATQLLTLNDSKRFVDGATRTTQTQIAACADRIAGLMPKPIDPAREFTRVERSAREALDRVRSDVALARKDYEEEERNYARFMAANRNPAMEDFPRKPTRFVALMSTTALAEGLLSTGLYMGAQAHGVLGGLLLAQLASAANVSLGVVCGYWGLRETVHADPARRRRGKLVTSILLTLALLAHGTLAVERGAGGDLGDAVAAVALGVLGAAAFLLAAYKARNGGWSVYPGLSDAVIRRRRAEANFDDALANARVAFANGVDAEVTALATRLAQDEAVLAEIREIAAEAARIQRTLGDSAAACEALMQAAYRSYCDHNLAVRTTLPPGSFAEIPTFGSIGALRLDLTAVTQLVAQAEAIVAENRAKLAELEKRVLREETAILAEINRAAKLLDSGPGEMIAETPRPEGEEPPEPTAPLIPYEPHPMPGTGGAAAEPELLEAVPALAPPPAPRKPRGGRPRKAVTDPDQSPVH